MIKCSRSNRWGLNSCNKEKPANTAAVKEMESKLSNAIAERQRLDSDLWGQSKATPLTKKMEHFANAGN